MNNQKIWKNNLIPFYQAWIPLVSDNVFVNIHSPDDSVIVYNDGIKLDKTREL